jgi:predicted enzyme related to lactoylglutathione lyase
VATLAGNQRSKGKVHVMKVERIDHVHVCTGDLEKAVQFFGPLLGRDFYPVFDATELGARTAFNPLGLDLIQLTDPNGIAAKALGNCKEGALSISLKVPNIEEAIAEMESNGIRLLAKLEFGKVKEAVFDSVKTFGLVIELCEYSGVDIALAAIGHQ